MTQAMPKTKNPSKKTDASASLQQHVHSRFLPLVVAFAVVATAVAGLVFYTAFAKTTIIITPSTVDQEQTFEFTAEDVDGVRVEASVEDVYAYSDFSGVVEEPAQATGTVIIYNNYSESQPLVETTRLLSESGVLFRTAETVTVPAGSQVEVAVYADQEGATGNIEPSKFEIVALWDGLKDNIYAESTSAMTGGVVRNVVITQEHIDAALQLANESFQTAAIKAAQEQANIDIGALTSQSLSVAVTEQVVSHSVGEQANELTITTRGTADGLLFTKEKLSEAIRAETGVEIKPERISYEVVAENDELDAQLVVQASAAVSADVTDTSFVKPKDLTNKTASEIIQMLEQYPQVENVTVHFNPFWTQRTPLDESHIVVKLN